jgi:hypothetical protein
MEEDRKSGQTVKMTENDPYATLAAINSFKVRGIDFNLRRSLVFARDTGINDGLRLRWRSCT